MPLKGCYQLLTLGGAMIAFPICLQMVLEYKTMQTGASIAHVVRHCEARREDCGRKTTVQPYQLAMVGF